MLRAILVDDEESNISSLKEKLNRHCSQVEIIATCNSAEKAIESIHSLRPGIVFLDIEMPVMNGFLMLQQLEFRDFELVFTTAYDHYAIKAIRFSALDYLVKPIEIEDLKVAVARAETKRANLTSANQLELLLENLLARKENFQKIAIPTTDGLQFVKVNTIIYLEANANYTHIFLEDAKKYIVCHTLKEFEDILPADTFVRVHNSYIINKNFAEKYIRGEGGQVVLSNGSVIDISKRKKTDFLKAFGH
ncbi:MAG: LytTR family DNA-binding domain-containing protein [Bacteroidota bacterium]|nr:LytTR family DNA-binding domain-containing protein [Bacteroidota bacterium]MDP4215728.1 LytTR family DNA-binding domain-containing protein [Bacteroidota bacterium]MDP4244790.1 LytTR family DNA-binding domain-containing protein [Bacteroidota bacterium]MDP4254021.1 LytTR family DNA-binding domain-containing protein [Bacteroidota bacterium]MDP4259321.1 LytTR family DNA-binding domain-containing protein [Bacteroidota bacterium]